MEVGEVIYSSPYHPDPTRALDVLAFLLTPEEAFVDKRDDAATRKATFDVLRGAKRDALERWYSHHMRNR